MLVAEGQGRESLPRPQETQSPTLEVVISMAQTPFEIRPSVLFLILSLVLGVVSFGADILGDGQNNFLILVWYGVVPLLIILYFFVIRKNRCTSCGSAVPTSEIHNTLKMKITAFSEGTQAVTSLNPVVGFGSGGLGASIGIGAMKSTSYTPVKLASCQCSVKCPECEHAYYWTSIVKVRIWTSVEGVESVEAVEPVSYPFKMV
jgi:hypothetical protein